MSHPIAASFALPAGVAAVRGLLTGPDWPAAKAASFQDDCRVVSRTEDATGAVTVATVRALPDGVPGFLARFLPPDPGIAQTEVWHLPGPEGVCHGTWSLVIPGAPGQVQGTVRLEPTAQGCREVLEGTATVKIPLVGGRAESFIAELAERMMAREAVVLSGLLG